MSQNQSIKGQIGAIVLFGFCFGGFIFGHLTYFIYNLFLPERYRALFQSTLVFGECLFVLSGMMGVAIALLLWIGRQIERSLFDPNFWRYFWSKAGKKYRVQWFLAILAITCGAITTSVFHWFPGMGFIGGFVGMAMAGEMFYESQTRQKILNRLIVVICYPPIMGLFAFIFSFQGTLLHAAAFLGYPKLFPYGSGAIRVGDREDKTPLHYAARRDRARAIVILLNEGADIHAKDEDGHTALHDAADYGSLQAVKTLVRSGAKIDVGDRYGNIPVQKAAQSGHVEIVRYLLDITPDVSRESTLALWNAVLNNWVETAEVAIAKGADVKSERSEKSLLDSARSPEMIKILQEAQSK